jgi:hypothetical protein
MSLRSEFVKVSAGAVRKFATVSAAWEAAWQRARVLDLRDSRRSAGTLWWRWV